MNTEFDALATDIAVRQYAQPGETTVEQVFQRVVDTVYPYEPDMRDRMYTLMVEKKFCPGGRILAGAGTPHGNLLNCFVQDGSPFEPGSTEYALHTAKKLAQVTKVGGGNGVNLDPYPGWSAPEAPMNLGHVFLFIHGEHPDADDVHTGTFTNLVTGQREHRGYENLLFVTSADKLRAEIVCPEDDIVSIWDAASKMVRCILLGKDVLVDLTNLRPEGTAVRGSGGTSSGPSSFAVEIFDNFATWAYLGGAEHAGPVAALRYLFAPTLRCIRQGGVRRGAGMATLSYDHPDILDFISSKALIREESEGDIGTFNISVLITGDKLVWGDPILQAIAAQAHATGEPGLLFTDHINNNNPLFESDGPILATNPSLRRGTRVLTDKGIVPIETLEDHTFEVQTLSGDWAPARCFLSGTDKPLYRIKFSTGNEVFATPEHRWPVAIKGGGIAKIDTAEMQVGQYVPFLDGVSGIQVWDESFTYDEGLLVGWMYGDGWFGNNRNSYNLMFTEDCLPIAERILQTYRALSGTDHNNLTKQSDGTWALQGGNAALHTAMQRMGVTTKDAGLPEAVWKSNPTFVRGFLEGLLSTDGSVSIPNASGNGRLTVTTAHEALAHDLVDLLGFLGVKTSLSSTTTKDVSFPNGKTYAREYTRYDLQVDGTHLLPLLDLTLHQPHKQTRWDAVKKFLPTVRRHLPGVVRVAGIELTELREDVWDIQVEHPTHTFRIAPAITGNCGEIPLYPGEPCDLGAMNVSAYVKDYGFDAIGFREDVYDAFKFLDRVLDVETAPLQEIADAIQDKRRVGLGLMGLADAMIKLDYPYNSEEGRAFAGDVAQFLISEAERASFHLLQDNERPAWLDRAQLIRQRRNVALVTVAPTGTTSMLFGVTSGIEPLFAPFIYRRVGTEYKEILHPLFVEMMNKHLPDGIEAWDWEYIQYRISRNHGSVVGLDIIPVDVRRVFRCAHDIAPIDHVKMQGVVQRRFDQTVPGGANSISKTINLSSEATVNSVLEVFVEAWYNKCKGITCYRDGSRANQVLSTSREDDGSVPMTPEMEDRLDEIVAASCSLDGLCE